MPKFFGLHQSVLLALCFLRAAQSLPAFPGGHVPFPNNNVEFRADHADELAIGHTSTMSHDVPSSMVPDHKMHYEDKSNVITASEPPENTKPKGMDEIDHLNSKEIQEEIDAWDEVQTAKQRYYSTVYQIGSTEPLKVLEVIKDIKHLRFDVARYIGEVMKGKIGEKDPGATDFSEEIQELIQIQDLLLPHVENEVTRLGGADSIISTWVQKGDLPKLIYSNCGSSPENRILFDSQDTLSYHDYKQLKLKGKVPETPQGNSAENLARRLNILFHKIGSFEIDKTAEYYETTDNKNSLRLQNSILETIHYMYKNNLINLANYREFYENEKTIDLATIDMFYGPYQDEKPSYRKQYLNFPIKDIFSSLGSKSGYYKEMSQVIDDKYKRRATYNFLKLHSINDKRFQEFGSMEDVIEATKEHELAAIENGFSELNLRETVFKNTEFLETLEDGLASKEAPEKLSEELKIQMVDVKKKLIDIGNFFSKTWDLPNIEEKDFYLKFSFLTLDFAKEKYGIDLGAEQRIGGNFKEKFKAMSQSSSFVSELHHLEKDIMNFGWDGYSSKGPSTLEESHEISGRILMMILENNKLKFSLEGSGLTNHPRIEEIDKKLDKLLESNSFDYFVHASERMRERKREIEPETEEMDIPIQEEVGVENNEVSKDLLEEMKIEPDSIQNLFQEEDETDSEEYENRKRKETKISEEKDLEKRQKVSK